MTPDLILSGASGRMGREVAAAAKQQGLRILFGVDRVPSSDLPFPVHPSFDDCAFFEGSGVFIDFSLADHLQEVLSFACRHHLPCVLGATGYTREQLAAAEQAAGQIPVFLSSNLSLGVYALKKAAAYVAALLPGWDIEIVEKHHSRKKDAPSGTAMTLYEAVRGEDSVPKYGRGPQDGPRQAREIGISAVRGGTVPGEHEVGFYGAGETVLMTHTAQNRSIFAYGALKAALFLQDRAPGMYGMDDLFAGIPGK